jgi:hypothetical protein
MMTKNKTGLRLHDSFGSPAVLYFIQHPSLSVPPLTKDTALSGIYLLSVYYTVQEKSIS